jgi:microcystin-dependent protein
MLPIAFPASLDAFVNPSASSKLNDQLVPHSEQHARLNDAVVALQVKVGVDESEDASSLDAKVSALQAGKSDTSHTHDTRYYTESEVDALIAAIPSGDPSAAWPVGSVFISVVNTNPATLLGFGTWAAFAAGRVLVGLDAGDADFDTLEETGGAKTVTLTTAQMPSHTHVQNAHNHIQDPHSHVITSQTATTGGATSYEHGTLDTSSAEAEATETTNPTTATNQAATAVNQNTGGDAAHPNVQPYITVRMWKRTA